jgi:hypothetical protein
MKAALDCPDLIRHIDGTTTEAKIDASWTTSDYTVLCILHATIDEDISDMILAGDQTTRQIWFAARDLFSANKTIYLDNEFRQLDQGTSTISDYFQHQKHLADAHAENDSTISYRALVLNTLRGLGPRFTSTTTVISMTEPLPTYLRARGMLRMEEM